MDIAYVPLQHECLLFDKIKNEIPLSLEPWPLPPYMNRYFSNIRQLNQVNNQRSLRLGCKLQNET